MGVMDLLLFLVSMVISQDQFNNFHAMDRYLYRVLVTDLCRNPVESMKIMALWIWFEQDGRYNIVKDILNLPTTLISELADEAVICLKCIYNPVFSVTHEGNVIPLTLLVVKIDLSLQDLREKREQAAHGLAKVFDQVCIRAFTDLMELAISRNNALVLPPQPRPHAFAQAQIHNNNNNNNSSGGNGAVPAEERTMFVTFSKGYPVAEHEVRNFFTQLFGDCIDSFHMQEVKGENEQALYARIVFFRADIIHLILNGVRKAKFTINGKHVWMRKFVPKRPRNNTVSPQSPRNQNRHI